MLQFVFVIVALVCKSSWGLEDRHENCAMWADMGECDNNPDYMLDFCAKSCQESQPGGLGSFYDIVEKDASGNDFHFGQLRNKVVYIVNVASRCGYTHENYMLLQKLAGYRDRGLEIIIFPCNQFGAQESAKINEIVGFAQNYGYQGLIMAKGDVNGINTRPTFRFLKRATNKKHIQW